MSDVSTELAFATRDQIRYLNDLCFQTDKALYSEPDENGEVTVLFPKQFDGSDKVISWFPLDNSTLSKSLASSFINQLTAVSKKMEADHTAPRALASQIARAVKMATILGEDLDPVLDGIVVTHDDGSTSTIEPSRRDLDVYNRRLGARLNAAQVEAEKAAGLSTGITIGDAS